MTGVEHVERIGRRVEVTGGLDPGWSWPVAGGILILSGALSVRFFR